MEEINCVGPEGNPFKILLSRRAFSAEEIITGSRKLRVMSKPVQIEKLIKSRWWIINFWRRITGTERIESVWEYTVKMI